MSYDAEGIEIQTYAAILACMLIALWRGRHPTRRTHETICVYFTGLADEPGLPARIRKRQTRAA